MSRSLAALALLCISLTSAAGDTPQHSVQPKAGFVPDAATAIRIAVAVWTPIYGEKSIAAQAPYKAQLIGDTWLVEGSLRSSMPGGIALAEISKSTAEVLRVSHSR